MSHQTSAEIAQTDGRPTYPELVPHASYGMWLMAVERSSAWAHKQRHRQRRRFMLVNTVVWIGLLIATMLAFYGGYMFVSWLLS
jgi:hypothetical protein